MTDSLTWIFIFCAYALLWWPAARKAGLALLICGLGLAATQSALTLPSLLAFALLIASGWLVRGTRQAWLGHLIFIITAIALALHLLPGFHNPLIIDSTALKPGSTPMRLYFNLDKPLIAWWVLLVMAPPFLRFGWQDSLRTGLQAGIAAAICCLGLAWVLGALAWSPGWPSQGWPWLLNNALLVTMAEEAFFRAYIQRGLALRLGPAPACLLAALLFGLAHFAGGPALIGLAALAGLFYGWAFHRGGLAAAVLAHLLLNTLHLALFSYPALAH
ncbi:CPBP family intramembrane glutamic endopeptidase [Bordetella avium]|uniref:Membrane-associated protease n=1 Tax=Bordetella avium (strain 197N) TaxID=360910 RepID=Q2KZU9_BORA1|nr:CPBP family intramembrane glutamic endopeptidase [Bordetella avium]RIQ52709.1 CPBP family intramembrane metalloprotease [Bordetella avium]RIQ69393.1 CPBP family intramembrane metalloprotease [Bordetella avium]RIQ71506.1 CPBP family intramembrane metalloprotease [Bordetella avium]CAJ49625.1 putative membrane-associated protease [Bordetella avium 197N]